MYRLTPHVPRWLLRRLANPAVSVVPGRTYSFDAAIVVVDVVGSTLLAERLTAWGPRGVETLETLFNAIFGAVVSAAHAFGGDVTLFSGDATTCMWPVEDAEGPASLRQAALRASAAALDMQAAMSGLGTMDTPLGPVTLTARLGMACGPVTMHICGSAPQRQWVLAGPALRAAIQAETEAPHNRVRLHPSALEVLGEAATVDEAGSLVQLDTPVSPSPVQPPAVDDELVSPFIHPILVSRELAGPEEFVAEFRPVVSLFVQFKRAPQGRGQGVGSWLNDWIQAAQADIDRFGGWLGHLEMSEKGNLVLAPFGVPVAHEDDERRAVACALALRETAATLFPDLRLRMGITRGQLFAGTIGNPDRHAFTLVGDDINLAARLIELAGPGQIVASARVRNVTSEEFHYRDLGSEHVRGRRQAVPIYAVLGTRHAREGVVGRYLGRHERMVGREREFEIVQAVMERARGGQKQVLSIGGEPGIGKSHLVAELVHRWVAQGGVALGGSCLSFAEIPYLPWRWIVAGRCGLTSDMDREDQVAQLAHVLGQLPAPVDEPRYWLWRLPLLAEVLGLGVPDNELTRGLQGEVRRDNTLATVQALLRAGATQSPTLVLIEDTHWADDLSLQLAALVASEWADSPLLLVLAHRTLPSPLPASWRTIRDVPHHTSIVLSELTKAANQVLVEDCLGGAAVPGDLADLVFERTRGHPLFTEEIVRMFQDLGCIWVQDGAVGFDRQRVDQIRFPDTVQGVVQARVDQLEEGHRLTLKVASVIGRLFPYRVLAGVYPVRIEGAELRARLDTLERLNLTLLERQVPDLAYIFKNIITQEVVYESLAFVQRRLLHEAVARWYEQRYAAHLEPHYALLAYHYGRAEQKSHELHYLLLAADLATRTHAIAEAAAYYERALGLLDREVEPARTASVLMRLARVVHFTGQYDQAREYCQQALALYEQVGDPIHAAEACYEIAERLSVHDLNAALAYYTRGLDHVRGRSDARYQIVVGYLGVALVHRHQGRSQEAEESLQYALDLATETKDLDALWRCYRALSYYQYSRGERREAFETGALMVRYAEQADALVGYRITMLNNQACFAQEAGDLKAAIEAGEAGLSLARRAGVVSEQALLASTLAGIYNHTGDWDTAERILEEGLRLLAQRPHPFHEVTLHLIAGDTAYGRGDWQTAVEHWSHAEARSRAGTQQNFNAELRARLAMAWLQLGDLEQAAQWADSARTLAEEREQLGALAAGWRAQGMIERARGAWAAGEAAFEQALDLARALNDPVGTAHVLLEHGLLLLEAGRGEKGRARLHQAEEQAVAINLHPVAQAARKAYGAALDSSDR